ncbi:MAG: DUF1932 domain-containing protein [Alphaproteobacteria bacterium]
MTQPISTDTAKLVFIGFGEAGQAFVEGWGGAHATQTSAYDIKSDDPATSAAKQADYQRAGVTGAGSTADALRGADIIFSTVTADCALDVAQAAAKHIPQGAYFLDCNSCSPGTKRQSAAIIEAAGGRYVDVAIMAPVRSALHKTPLLISGPHTASAAAFLADLQMNAKVVAGGVGTSSTIKMVRSIMMKGLEAIFLECVLAGRQAGVDETVLASLDDTYPGFDFKQKAAIMIERAMAHGVRRAAEMREVAITVDELGLSGRMARATAQWEQQIGDLNMEPAGDDYTTLADALLAQLITKERVP